MAVRLIIYKARRQTICHAPPNTPAYDEIGGPSG